MRQQPKKKRFKDKVILSFEFYRSKVKKLKSDAFSPDYIPEYSYLRWVELATSFSYAFVVSKGSG